MESRLIELVSATQTFASGYVTNVASKAFLRRKRQAPFETRALPGNLDAGSVMDMTTPVLEEASAFSQLTASHILLQSLGRNVGESLL